MAKAIVAAEKLTHYLLNPDHKVGAPKLRFLECFGFSRSDPETVRKALIAHGSVNPASVVETEYGVKYEVDGPLLAPTGEAPFVRTVWQIDLGETDPKFVTMRPLKGNR
jgi:hypothetical protein